MKERFRKFSSQISNLMGAPGAFLVALAAIVIWGITGPIFDFSDTWQLVINTATTIITFLMVFLIQNTQNRDAKAIHLKLDELIRSMQGARNSLLDLENLSDDDLERLEKEFQRIRRYVGEHGHMEDAVVEVLADVHEELREEHSETEPGAPAAAHTESLQPNLPPRIQ
jgi:low affinity Fe/Cu permease